MGLLHISIRPPFATAVIRWGVTQLSRQSPPPKWMIGQRIAIHCATSIDRRTDKPLRANVDGREFLRIMHRLEAAGVLPEAMETLIPKVVADVGGILGSIRIVCALTQTKGVWPTDEKQPTDVSPGVVPTFPCAWVFEDPEPFAEVTWSQGATGYWTPGDIILPGKPGPKGREPPHRAGFGRPESR